MPLNAQKDVYFGKPLINFIQDARDRERSQRNGTTKYCDPRYSTSSRQSKMSSPWLCSSESSTRGYSSHVTESCLKQDAEKITPAEINPLISEVTGNKVDEFDDLVHPHVLCDSCDGPVVGFRYRCLTCPNTDLCQDCERDQLHAQHNMIRISSLNRDSPATHAQLFLLRNASLPQKLVRHSSLRKSKRPSEKNGTKTHEVIQSMASLSINETTNLTAKQQIGAAGSAESQLTIQEQIRNAVEDSSLSLASNSLHWKDCCQSSEGNMQNHCCNTLGLSSDTSRKPFDKSIVELIKEGLDCERRIPSVSRSLDDCDSCGSSSSSFELLAIE
ncbi:uncharacterized protein LOC108665543 isoform X2 [Hyalella azteca]|uniref:Uncharacterized protein LOC108665543 isoform X2 n=1 Tax=Hyalella azteca TaxID=294128 RepID=A0A8B7N1S3_HYAAZ|nr:uncharacterized protein LOC108665543 isoform X2 [Hyalella azteca]